jgi:hypothetical protein
MAHFPGLAMQNASFLQTVKAVVSGFLGVRKRADAERVRFNPLHLAILAVAGVVLFIFTIRTIVRIVVG